MYTYKIVGFIWTVVVVPGRTGKATTVLQDEVDDVYIRKSTMDGGCYVQG